MNIDNRSAPALVGSPVPPGLRRGRGYARANEPPRPYLTPVPHERKLLATAVIIVGLALCILMLPSGEPLEIFRFGAYFVGLTLALAFLVQASGGLKSLLEPDTVMLFTLYFLTYAEFLLPNLRVLRHCSTGGAISASELVMLSFGGLAVGRHLPIFSAKKLASAKFPEASPRVIFWLFIAFSFFGYLYVLLSVHFDPTQLWSKMWDPRFMTPWQRGRLGNWWSFLEELKLLLYAAAAIGGYIEARPREFGKLRRVFVAGVLAFTFLFGVGGGGRNVVVIQTGLFLMAFVLANRKPLNFKLIVFGMVALVGLWVTIGYMLQFRNFGMRAAVEGTVNSARVTEKTMIDNNMYSIAGVIDAFPEYHQYPGFGVVWTSIVHPIPRAIWPGKPVDWKHNIEDALGVKGATVAVTFVGESYLMAGFATTLLVSLIFGAVASAWTRIGLSVRTNTGLIFYVSGFYAVTLGMRSLQWITVAVLPTIAVYVIARMFRRARARRMVVPFMGGTARGRIENWPACVAAVSESNELGFINRSDHALRGNASAAPLAGRAARTWWPYLDLARCLAALLVVVSHLRAFLFPEFHAVAHLGAGWHLFYFLTGFGHEAVMIFFVLSGFLVGGGAMSRVMGGEWSWRDYAITRMTRLWIVLAPALVLTAFWDKLGILLAGSSFYSGGLVALYRSGPSPDPSQFSAVTFLGNLAFLQTILVPTFGSNGPLWSLANEFWYYLIFPLFFCGLAGGASFPSKVIYTAFALTLCFILPRILVLYGVIWLFGVVVFALCGKIRLGASRNLILASAVVMLGAALTASWFGALRGFAGDLAIGLAFAALLLPLSQIRSFPSLGAGLINTGAGFSYTLYLVHFPFAAFVVSWIFGNKMLTPDLIGMLIYLGILALVILYAYAVYLLFERNTRQVRNVVFRFVDHFSANKLPARGVVSGEKK